MRASSSSGPEPSPSRGRVCHISRSTGWIDPNRPRRPISEVNLLAVALGSPVWTLGTAWESVFHSLIPRDVEKAYRKASAGLPLRDEEVARLRAVAERLQVELDVRD